MVHTLKSEGADEFLTVSIYKFVRNLVGSANAFMGEKDEKTL